MPLSRSSRKTMGRKSRGKKLFFSKKRRGYSRRSNITKIVKSILKPELKQQSIYDTLDQSVLIAYSAPISQNQYFTSTVGGVLADVNQGTGQGDRTGNKVQVKNLIVKGTVYTNSSAGPNATAFGITGPVYVDVYCGYRRDLQNVDPRLLQFFQDGDGWITPSGSSKDLLYSINKDVYIILAKRRLKIGCNTYTNSTVSYNDYSQHKEFTFNLKKYVAGKIVSYQDSTAQPTSPWWNALSIWTTVINPATGQPFPTNPATTQSLGIYINFVSTVYFTDD